MTIEYEVADNEDLMLFRNGKPRQQARGLKRNGKPIFGSRAFLSWDGEGYSVYQVDSDRTCERQHRYCLFGNSNGRYVSGVDLSTKECFDFLRSERTSGNQPIHVAFAFDYDVNMMLRDLTRWQLERLRKRGWVKWNGYRIEHRPKKWFQLSWRDNGTSQAIRIYDVFTFFSCSLTTAIKLYIPDFEHLNTVQQGKDRRSQFGYHELDSVIIPYWKLENDGLVKLMEQFRKTLYAAEINISSWHGPGAIATYLFTKNNVKKALGRTDNAAIEYASRCAYAGGRFELFRAGHYEGEVYGYDINSAYPYAITGLPNMLTGEWVYTDDSYNIKQAISNPDVRMAYIRLESSPPAQLVEKAIYDGYPMPLFHRSPTGSVAFPVTVENWYHLNEVSWLVRNSKYRVLKEAWIYHDDGSHPFSWVADIYNQRQRWKQDGNPAELAAKLGLNSLYGKMAQRIGWDEEKGLPPPWHQLDWAGFITSLCRSMVWIPMLEAASTGSLISVETDGIFSTTRLTQLPNGLGSGLGQWKETRYTAITVLQSGMYWLRSLNGTWLAPKSRGIPRERLNHETTIKALRMDEPIVRAQHTSFVGYGRALISKDAIWRTWQPYDREYRIGGDGKRFHNGKTCTACSNGIRFNEGFHPLCIGRIEGRHSTPHALPWRDGEAFYSETYDRERRWNIRGS